MKALFSHLTPLLVIFFSASLISCNKNGIQDDFNSVNDRVWIGENYWGIPMEDWQLKDGKIHSTGQKANMRLNFLSYSLGKSGSIKLSLDMGISGDIFKAGRAGLELGLQDDTDNGYKSLCYFGLGLQVGVDPEGYIFLGDRQEALPEGFDLTSTTLSIRLTNNTGSRIVATLSDLNKKQVSIIIERDTPVTGPIAAFNSIQKTAENRDASYWFDNIRIKGSALVSIPENRFGPVLWAMYTLSDNKLKLSTQMPPLGELDNKTIHLELRSESQWERIATAAIVPDAFIATFTINNWESEIEHHYRVVYDQINKQGKSDTHYYEGIIRAEPKERPLIMGAMTCQYHYGFPYQPIVNNLEQHDPDILFFSGDQVYEANGGYGIERFPADRAILNYLGKWYMFGWAFGDLMRERPSICIPDDHEVFQGNLWGNNGIAVSMDKWGMNTDCLSGFVEPAEMVKVVMLTNCSHLPDPYDPEPMEQEIPVYYTEMKYGDVNFAIVGDRVFKSGPELVATWEGRKDHIKDPGINPADLENPGLRLLGDRQIGFITNWVNRWDSTSLMVLLSQTLLTNSATHHGGDKMILLGDMDSGGWPKTGRDKALSILRQANVFHICGDQHLPFLIQYGIDDFRDAGWAYCTPAITVGYQRRFLPDTLGWPVSNRPMHGLSNTGYYTDAFTNKNYVYAVGNPEDITANKNRYLRAQLSSSGFGIVRFNPEELSIECEAYRFLATFGKQGKDDIFPGWPLKIFPGSKNK